VANSVAIRELYPRARVAIELGGQDAKIIFFHLDGASDQLMATDMRMNGSCAGGTGAFIDEMAGLLKVPPEGFEALASRGTHVYDISGRCGVFAKTDIQPLLNQGVSREDIALSALHAIAKQTIGGLAQGLEIQPPVLFEGGPLTFNPTLVRVFAERLGLKGIETRPGDVRKMVLSPADRVLVDIKAGVSEELLADIRQRGGNILNSFAQYQSIRAALPLKEIESVAARTDVVFIGPAVKMTVNTGSVDSQGDVAK